MPAAIRLAAEAAAAMSWRLVLSMATARGAAIRAWSGLALAGFWLAACAVGPDYAVPALDLPERWTNAAGNAAAEAERPELASWWRNLDDPLLDELIAEAVQGNLDVASARAAIREARASRRQQAGALEPSLDGSAAASRSGTGDGDSADQFRAGFDARWELDLFGGNSRALEAATRGLEVAENDLRATLLTLIGDVALTYVELRGYQARIALSERTVTSQRATAALTRDLLEAGSSSALDLARAVAQASSTEAGIPSLEAGYADTLHRLGVLLGQPPGTLAARLDPQRPIPAPRQFTSPGVPADLLLARPDIRAAERQLAQATALIGQAEAARYPSISLSGTLSTSAARIGDLARSSSIAWSLGPSLTIPIFDGGQLSAAVEGAQAQRDRYYVAFRGAVLTALQEVESALVALAQERRRLERLDETAAAYRDVVRLSTTLFQSGSSGFLDVLDAERTLYSAEDSLLQSRIAVATSYIALNKALGGGWDGDIDTTRPEIVDADTGPRLRR